jgi:hypothetical protein
LPPRLELLTEAETAQLDILLADPDLVLYCGGTVSGWGQRADDRGMGLIR